MESDQEKEQEIETAETNGAEVHEDDGAVNITRDVLAEFGFCIYSDLF
jgi:hypothetical protein